MIEDFNDREHNPITGMPELQETPEEKLERHRKILSQAREELKNDIDYDYDNRINALLDLEFAFKPKSQWPSQIRAERESEGRPCLEINKIPTYIDQVVGDQRQNRPSIKAIPEDSIASPRIAKILSGWFKNVQAISKADIAIDHAFEHSVSSGYGCLRILTKYIDNSVDEQEAYIEKVDNALSVYWGKHAEYDCSDANHCFIISDVDRKEYKEKYGEEPMSFEQANLQGIEGWFNTDTVRLAEYFRKEPVEKTLYRLQNGSTVEELYEGDVVIKSRKVKTYKIKWYLLSGNKVLDEREWVGKKYIPVIPVWGKEINIGGKRYVRSLIRYAKDAQMMYNYWESCDTEIIALAPKAPYQVTPEQIKGHEPMWNNAHRKLFPYLLVNPDSKASGWPKREAPPQASSAMTTKINMVDQSIRDTIGLQRSSMGLNSNARSGVQERERKQEGDTGTFAFIDNLSRSYEQIGRVLLDIAPGIIDTERIIRLIKENGDAEFDMVNQETETGEILNNIRTGKYGIVVTTGPSYTTQRTESKQAMKDLIQYMPQAAPLIGDKYVKLMDVSEADEMAERLEYLLPPEIRNKLQEKRARESGVNVEQLQPPQPEPDLLMESKIQESAMKLKELEIKLEQEKIKLQGMQLDNELKISGSRHGMQKMIDEIIQEHSTIVNNQ